MTGRLKRQLPIQYHCLRFVFLHAKNHHNGSVSFLISQKSLPCSAPIRTKWEWRRIETMANFFSIKSLRPTSDHCCCLCRLKFLLVVQNATAQILATAQSWSWCLAVVLFCFFCFLKINFQIMSCSSWAEFVFSHEFWSCFLSQLRYCLRRFLVNPVLTLIMSELLLFTCLVSLS